MCIWMLPHTANEIVDAGIIRVEETHVPTSDGVAAPASGVAATTGDDGSVNGVSWFESQASSVMTDATAMASRNPLFISSSAITASEQTARLRAGLTALTVL